MIYRRAVLMVTAATAALCVTRLPARAEGVPVPPAAATAFVQSFGAKLIAVVNGEGSMGEKQQRIRPLIDQTVDVEAIAKFCLGRFITSATPQQVAEFTTLFHAVLNDNISTKIGQFRGVTFAMGNAIVRGGETLVSTVVTRPDNAPNNVQWVVDGASGSPKIVDVVAEGTSLRLTQRSDYASYMAQHGGTVAALITALRAQVKPG